MCSKDFVFLQNSSLRASLTEERVLDLWYNTSVNLSRMRKCWEERVIGSYGN